MNAACDAAYSGSRAASIGEIANGCIVRIPATNDSGRYLVGACPLCAGAAWTGAVDGHCRNCVRPGDTFPTILPPHTSWEDFCCNATRSTACVLDPPWI